MNLLTLSMAFSRKHATRGTSSPIAEPSENMLAVTEVAVGFLLLEAGLTMLKYSLAPGIY